MSIFNQKPDFKSGMIDEHEQNIKSQGDEARAERQMVEMPPQDIDNPFNAMDYRQFQGPDVPVSMGNNMAEALLSDDIVPEEIKSRYWHVFHRDNVLTFLDAERKRQKLLNMDIMKIDLLNQTPYYQYNFENEYEMSVIRNVYETKLDRALGTRDGVKNERTTLQSQFTENKNISEVSQNEVSTTGFFKKLLGRKR